MSLGHIILAHSMINEQAFSFCKRVGFPIIYYAYIIDTKHLTWKPVNYSRAKPRLSRVPPPHMGEITTAWSSAFVSLTSRYTAPHNHYPYCSISNIQSLIQIDRDNSLQATIDHNFAYFRHNLIKGRSLTWIICPTLSLQLLKSRWRCFVRFPRECLRLELC